MRPVRHSFPLMVLFSSNDFFPPLSSHCTPSKILANGCKGPNSDSPFHGFKISPVSFIAIIPWGSRFLLLANLSKWLWYFLTTLVSALCSTLVAVEFPFLYKEAQGERQEHLTKAASRYCVSLSGEEASLVWAVPCGWATGRDPASLYSGECENSLSWVGSGGCLTLYIIFRI